MTRSLPPVYGPPALRFVRSLLAHLMSWVSRSSRPDRPILPAVTTPRRHRVWSLSASRIAVIAIGMLLAGWLGATRAQAQNGLAFMHGADDNSGSGTGVSVFVSNGNGTFKLTKTFDTGFSRDNLGTEVFGDDGSAATFYVDATGDGVVDIVHATEANGQVAGNFICVYPGTGKGGFAKSPIVTSNLQAGPDGYNFAGIDCCQQSYMADVDGDGKVDYVFSGSDDKVSVYAGNGNGTFSTTRITTSLTGATGYHTSGVTTDEVGFLVDVNGDGKADLIHTNQYPSTTKVWLATSGGSFATTPVTTTGFAATGASVFTGKGGNETSQMIDVTGDGKADFVHANEFSGANTVYVFAGDGAGGFATAFTSSVLTNPPGTFNYVIGEYGSEYSQWVDVTGDGKADFVTSHDGLGANSGIYVYTNGGTGSFNPTPVVSLVGCGNFQTGADFTETTAIVKVFGTGTTFSANGRAIPATGNMAPGGVTADLAIWLRADDLAATQTEGSRVDVWSDAVTGGESVHAFTTDNNYKPTLYKSTTSKLVNYNPSLSFNGDLANYLYNDHRIYCPDSPFQLISLGFDERQYITEYRGTMGVGPDGNYPAFDLYTDGNSPNGWRPYMGNSSPNIFNGGGALLYNGNTGGTNRQPQIFSLGSANAVTTTNYGADNIVSRVDGYKENTTLDAFQTNVYIGNYLFVGSSGGEYWKGRIPETAIYTRQLTDPELKRIDSYLAAKYGITLDQRTATDYVASDGTTKFWNAVTNTGYKANIGAIGRDDASGLSQKQSKSVNIQDQPIISLASIAVSNSANAGSFGADKSFAAWADNGQPHSFSIAYAPTTFTPAGGVGFYRMAATWRMQETGAVGTSFFVGIPASSFADRLLISGTPAFIPGATQEVLLAPDGKGNLVTTSAVTITDGQFFTFGAAEKAPGGVVSGLRMWLKANTLTGNDGDKVTKWTSSVLSYPFSAVQATVSQQPTLGVSTTALVNFNQMVNFNRGAAQGLYNTTQSLLTGGTYATGGTPSFHFFTVGKDKDPATVGAPYYGSGNIRATMGNGEGGNNPGLDMYKDLGTATGFRPYSSSLGWWGGSNETVYNGGGTNKQTAQPVTILSRMLNQQPQLFGLGFTWAGGGTFGATSTSFANAWVDGYKATTNLPFNNSYLSGSTPYFTVGSSGGGEYWNGSIGEVINYTRELSDAEVLKVNTYLALKYGTTLGQGGSSTALVGSNVAGQDYTATDGTIVWNHTTNTGYAFDIAGIGQDNFEGLLQKQSQSVNRNDGPDGFQPAIGLGTVEVSNDANPGVFTTDKSYMTWGSNGASSNYATVYSPKTFTAAAPTYLMDRVWKVQETTNAVGMVTVSIPGSTTGVYLLVSGTGSFTTGTPTEKAMTSDGAGNLVATVDFTTGQYFTFAKIQYAPGCVATGLDFWFDPAVNVTKVGSTTVTAWGDRDGSGNNPIVGQATTTLQPTYSDGDAASNFNPYINFANNDRLHQTVTGSDYSSSHTTFGVVNNYTFKADWTHFIRFADASNADAGTHNWGMGHNNTQTDNVNLHYIKVPFSGGSGSAGTGGIDKINQNRSIIIGQNTLYGGLIDSSTPSSTSVIVTNNGNEASWVGTANAALLVPNNYLTIGGGNAYGMNNNKTSEIIHYARALTLNERQRVNTYLGIKHGLTLEHNYLAGNSTVIYNVSSYSANVFGIGRDDCQQLEQKQSKSVNSTARMSIGLSGTVAATNAANPGSFTTDAAFLVIGDNGGTGTSSFSSTTASCPTPPAVDKYTNLSYKVTETNSVSAVFIQFDASGYGFNPIYPLYMQVFGDAAFTNLITSVPMSFSGSTATTNYDFPANSTAYVRFAGNTTSLANICQAPQTQTFHWNGWWYGTKSKTIVGNFGLNSSLVNPVMSVSITDGTTDPNVLLYKPTVNWWPVFDGLGIFIPRYDNTSNQNSVVTTQMSFFSQASAGVASTSAVAAQTVDFVLRDIDGYVGGKDVVKVYGKLGAAIVYPKITKNNLYPSLASTALTINQSTGTITGGPLPWDLTVLGDAYVTFDSPVEQVFVEYTKQNTYGFNVYNDLRIGEINVTCKAPTPRAALADNVYVYKQATPNVQKTNEPVSYKFTIQNTACNNKVIDFTDNLPGGLTFVDSTLTTSLAYGSLNAYGNAQNLSIGSLIVPPGTSYLYARVKGTTQGTYNNQATYTVQGGTGTTLLSDDPGQSGTGTPTATFQPTPLTLIQNDPDAQLAVAKSVDKTVTGQNTTVTYSFTVSSANSASAVKTTFTDVLPGELTFVPGSLSGLSGAYTSSTAVSAYGGQSTVSLRDLNVPAGGSVSFSIQANVNSYTLGAVAPNTATATPDALSGFRIKSVNSNTVSTTITAVPSVTINSPLNNTQTSLTPTIAGTATPGALVTITGPGNATLCSTTATAGGSYSCTLSTLTGGPQTLTAVATNANGTSIPATVSLTAVAPPTVAITSPTVGANLSSSNPPISGTATPGASVTVAGGTGVSCITTASSTGSWTCTNLNFSSGPQTVSATAGNVGGTSPTATTSFSVAAPLTVNTSPASASTTTGISVSGNAGAAITPGGGTQPLTYSAFNPTSGSATSASAISTPHGTATIDPVTGVYSYTPTAGYSGTDAIGIKVCDNSSPTPQCASSIIPITITAPSSASGTLDCSSAQLTGIVAGTPGNGILKLTINVTTAGPLPVTVSGSGLSASPSPYPINASATGMQAFYVPVVYSGAAFGPTTITVTGAGICSPDLSLITPKTVSTAVLNLGPACTPATAATLVK